MNSFKDAQFSIVRMNVPPSCTCSVLSTVNTASQVMSAVLMVHTHVTYFIISRSRVFTVLFNHVTFVLLLNAGCCCCCCAEKVVSLRKELQQEEYLSKNMKSSK